MRGCRATSWRPGAWRFPAGSRVIGSVTMVERGGKVKEPARLGIRFHTLVLADGSEVPLAAPSRFIARANRPRPRAAKKIGGAAVGGAILGAILGGGKGAAIGGATGAAGGTAAVMAGDRNAGDTPPGRIPQRQALVARDHHGRAARTVMGSGHLGIWKSGNREI